MKKILYVLKLFFCFVLLTTSCNKEILETKPTDEFSSADVWKDEFLAKSFINGIHASLKQGFMKPMQSVFVDEAHRRDHADQLNFNNCILTVDKIPYWPEEKWETVYPAVRKCNLFLTNTENAPFNADNMIGEVRFLRAWLYLKLTSLYGGVPIITKVYELIDNFTAPRNSYEDCIEFILDDLDQAASLLPVVQSEKGRPTKGAALALKAKVLLYAASDLHNTTVSPGYSNPEFLGYVGGDRTARWQAAKDAAKAVIDMNVYSLYKPNPAPTDSVAKNYYELFILKETVEDIWVRFYSSATIGKDNNMMAQMTPNGYDGQANNCPIGNLVDAFEMRDGTKFDWNNPAHAALPYNYREPRFYAYILYEGAKWRPRPSMSIALDPIGIIQLGYWERWDAATNSIVIENGIDSRNSRFIPNNSSQTLYYCRKFLDESFTCGDYDIRQDVPWRYIRYAEVLLNYAEACIELGQDAEARTYINMIRKRAGLPDVTESGTALRDRYRHEKYIEMMYEEQRFFDVRRWMIGPEAYNINVLAATVLYKLLPDKTTSPIPTIEHVVLQKRSWNDKAYFFPIMRDEMNKNDLLVQNPGY